MEQEVQECDARKARQMHCSPAQKIQLPLYIALFLALNKYLAASIFGL